MRLTNKIGVRFCFDGYNKHFAIIFKDINLNRYIWHVANSEIIYYNEKLKKACVGILTENKYSGKRFLEKINACTYYVIHARIFAAPTEKMIRPDEIVDYETFSDSDCEIALLCADSFVDFYAKDEMIIDAVADACKQNYKCKVTFLTRENDIRTGFYI